MLLYDYNYFDGADRFAGLQDSAPTCYCAACFVTKNTRL